MSLQEDQTKKEEMSYHERYGTACITVGKMNKHLTLAWKHEKEKVLCFVGESGIGKTQVVQRFAKDIGATYKVISVANYSLTGFGVPSISKETGSLQYNIAEDIPLQGPAIFHIDEINHGGKHVMAMLHSLVEERKMFEHRLGDDVLIVLSMNPAVGAHLALQGSKFENMTSFRRRISFFEVIASADDFLAHARTDAFHSSDGMKKPMHSMLARFVETAKDRHFYDAEAQLNNRQFACPAVLQKVSRTMYALEAEGWPLTDDFARSEYASMINPSKANELITYIEDHADVVAPQEVLLNYREKSDVRKRVLRLIKKDESGKLADLATSVTFDLMHSKPDVKLVARNYALYLSDHAPELVQATLAKLSDFIKQEDSSRDYYKKLNRELANDENWYKCIHENNMAFRNVRASLDKDDSKAAMPDPLATQPV